MEVDPEQAAVAELLRYAAALRRAAEAAYDEGYLFSAARKFEATLTCLDRLSQLVGASSAYVASSREPNEVRRARVACLLNIASCRLQMHGRAAPLAAARACRRVIALEPSSALAHFRLAQAQARAGAHESSLRFMRRALHFCKLQGRAAAADPEKLQKARAWAKEIRSAIDVCQHQIRMNRPASSLSAAPAPATSNSKAPPPAPLA